MKKVFLYAMAGALLVSSCGTYTGNGAYTGSMLGSILGSAIGGLSDGPRGSDIGSIIGMAGGAVVGAAIGSAADRAQEERIERKREEVRARIAQKEQGRTYDSTRGSNYGYDRDYNYGQLNGNDNYSDRGVSDSGYDPTNSGDDRIDFVGSSQGGSAYGDAMPPSKVTSIDSGSALQVRNVRVLDESRDRRLEPNEMMRLVFEVKNCSSRTLYDVRPHVEEVSGARNIFISPDARVESLGPGKSIRYTAMVKAGKRLRDGHAVFRVQAVQASGRISSNVEEIAVPTIR